MDDVRAFMAGRQAPFRLDSLRAIFVTPEDEGDDDEKVCTCMALGNGVNMLDEQCFMVRIVLSGRATNDE